MNFVIIYHKEVVAKDIPSLSSVDKRRIKTAIEQKLMTRPEIFGRPLRRSLKGYRKLRVGDFRIVFVIRGNLVKILVIEHRSIVYTNFLHRFE
jgi:mRNA interferase RelE/StbE